MVGQNKIVRPRILGEQSMNNIEKKANKALKVLNFQSIDELYDSIEPNGSLGLLALGALGLKLWRKKRKEIEGT